MLRRVDITIVGFALCAIFVGLECSARAGNIINLNGSSGPQLAIQYDGDVMSTAGSQTTPAQFIDFLNSIPDIAAATFTLYDVTNSGLAAVFNDGLFIQKFSGGTLSLYDESHVLLLSGALTVSGLSGTAGAPNGGLFTTTLSPVTGGTLAPYMESQSAVLQMHLSNINSGAGFVLGSLEPRTVTDLHSFTALANANINGQVAPEPTAAVLLLLGAFLLFFAATRSRSSLKFAIVKR